ncbi:ATP-binding cassette sub- D member 3 [Homalodisca vitripennis]|nr:ATP-binding cassette sub- D member 3 [Homalodisca vitripennis]
MAPNFSKYITPSSVAGVASVSFLIWLISQKNNKRPTKNKKPPVPDIQYLIGEKSPTTTKKAQVDAIFFGQLRKILSICIKGVFTPETGFLGLVAMSLIARSLCDIWMIQNHTAAENAIVTMNKQLFKKHITEFFIAMPLISLVNNVLKSNTLLVPNCMDNSSEEISCLELFSSLTRCWSQTVRTTAVKKLSNALLALNYPGQQQ